MRSSETWHLLAEARARKAIARASNPERDRLQAVLKQMEHEPFAGDVVRLHGQPTAFRRRVGDWRLFFDVYPDARLVRVRLIERRITTRTDSGSLPAPD